MNHKVPLVYKIILRRLYINSIKGEIEVSKARSVLRLIFRLGSENSYPILIEMNEMGLIEYKSHMTIQINKDCL